MYANMLQMLHALQSGETTPEKLIAELQSAQSYIRRGATFYPLVFENFSEINGKPANVYTLGDGIDRAGKTVEKRTRAKKSDAPKAAGAKKS